MVPNLQNSCSCGRESEKFLTLFDHGCRFLGFHLVMQNQLLKVLYILLPICFQSCVFNIILFPAGVESASSETFVDQLTVHGKHRVSLMLDKGLRASLFYNNTGTYCSHLFFKEKNVAKKLVRSTCSKSI